MSSAETSATTTQDGDNTPGPYLAPTKGPRPLVGVDREMWSDLYVRLSVLVVAALIFFPGIGSFGLWDPWEVHYGEVGRQMVERGDWLSPWWGSHWQRPNGGTEGEYFFSKPVLLLWMMGIGTQVFGFSEIAIRFGVALIATLTVGSVYWMGAQVFSRRVGLLMAGILLTSPFFFMLGRQAQTEIPFVGPMVIAMSFLMAGLFGRHRSRPADRATYTLMTVFLLGVVLPQLHAVTVGQLEWKASYGVVEAFFCWGPTQLGIYLLMMGVFFVTAFRSRQRTRGQVHLWMFYAFVGFATMGKGILGFALPGAIIIFYLLVTREWKMLLRAEIPRGILVALFVGFPWYGAMFARHGGIGGAFWDRFIIHDHFKRLATGVHQIDTGSFEHFIKWLGYGLFPWGGFVPAIIARAMQPSAIAPKNDQDRARLVLFLWFITSFALFTLSSTKFHHYIFPAVPALALLAALIIDDLLERRIDFRAWWPLWLGAAAITVLVGFDLSLDPQHLKNLFTYKYDREWGTSQWNHILVPPIRAVVVVGGVGMMLFAFARKRAALIAGITVLAVNGVAFAAWTLNVYMPTISPTFSQQELWNTYYERCTQVEPPRGTHPMKRGRYCEESAIAYELNWRGETYYTMNEVIPVADDEDWDYFMEGNGDRCFYAIMERSRLGGFRNALPAPQRASVRVEHDGNIKFILASANCQPPDGEGSGADSGSP